jgi:hypothetical protein
LRPVYAAQQDFVSKKNKNKSTAITTNPNQQQQTKAILPVGSSSNLE